jgi:hypothetical protein
MKIFLTITACMLLLSAAVSAQDDAEYQNWMKTVGATSASLKKNVEAKDFSAATDAKRLQDIFASVRAYWEKKNASDAVKLATDAESSYKQIMELASAGKFDEAAEPMKAAQATCGGCHMAHREKAADGAWKIK